MYSEICATNAFSSNSFSYEHQTNIKNPERDLLLAILQRAFLDYFGTQKRNKDNAKKWMFSETDGTEDFESDTMFTFDWICQHLDIDANKILSQLKKLAMEEKDLTNKYFQMRRRG